jgi:hypothetical protein
MALHTKNQTLSAQLHIAQRYRDFSARKLALPGGRIDMGVKIPLIPAPVRPMQREVHRDVVAIGDLPGEGAQERDLLPLGELVRQRDLVLARHPGILSFLVPFAAFQRLCRSCHKEPLPPGLMISRCKTPGSAEKSYTRPLR